MIYQVGDTVFWATASTAGEFTVIGHPKGDKDGKVRVLANSAMVGEKFDAYNPQRGREYRQRYFRDHPRGLEGNP